MSFSRYPKYRDSGVEYLWAVPEHWKVRRVKHSLRLLTEKTERRDFPVGLENIEGWTGRFIPTDTEFQGEGISFDRNDILFGKLRPYLAKVYLAQSPGQAVGDFFVLRPVSDIDSRFAQFQLLSGEFIAIVNGSTFGSKMPRASWEFVGGMTVAVPPLSEQAQIAAFLDRETGKIDTLVMEQQRLIELLKEKRLSVIDHAVTKGLDPLALMKPSGNQWLGDVPAHWDLKRLKYVKSEAKNAFVDGPFGSSLKSEHFVDDGDVYVIQSGFATQGSLDTAELATITLEHFRTISRSETRAGDIIIAKIGAQFGKSSILPRLDKPAVVSGNSLKLTVNRRSCDVRFVNWFLTNLKELGVMDDIVNATAQPALSLAEMNTLPMLVPPLHEQEAVTLVLEQSLAKLDSFTSEAHAAIALLKERRTALISAAVTGQIDVRRLQQDASS